MSFKQRFSSQAVFGTQHLPALLTLGLLFAPGTLFAQQSAEPDLSNTASQPTDKAEAVSATPSHQTEPNKPANTEKSETDTSVQTITNHEAKPCPEPKPCPETMPCPKTKACPGCPDTQALDSGQLASVQMFTGIVTTAIALPATLALGVAIGTGPSDLYAAGLPALFVLALLPPVATASAEWAMSRWLAGEQSGSLGWSMGAAGLAHVGAMATAVALGVSTHDLAATTTYVASESLLLPSVVTATLALTAAGEQAEGQEVTQ